MSGQQLDLREKSILVTGGTGSFGRRFAATLLRDFQPRRLVIFSRDELKQHEMRQNGFDHPSVRFFIGDVRDVDRLRRALHGVDIVVHAAALKQVPACEYNPFEAVLTNVMGARNVIEASIDRQVKHILALSTDKAVNPVNLYGATKLCAEKLFVQGNAYSGTSETRFACVRYGNVVGSRGSVIPVFLGQRATGRITITDPRMTRFWLTLDEAVQFVLTALSMMHGGEIFVPKIPSMNIGELAKAVAGDCRIEQIGIRPGEKLHEVLIGEDEALHTLELDRMFIVQPAHPWWSEKVGHAGRRLPEGFIYSSNHNPHWLKLEDLRELLKAQAADA